VITELVDDLPVVEEEPAGGPVLVDAVVEAEVVPLLAVPDVTN
jgi:hypothetical protein